MNRILFEASYIGSFRGFLNIILAFCTFFFLYFSFRGIARTDKNVMSRKTAGVITKVIIVIIVIYIICLIKSYVDTVIRYKSGNYIEVEGTVEYYHYSQGYEYITLNGVSFKCSSGIPWGYYPSNGNNSVIAGYGQHLRIRYIPRGSENVIVYIEQLLPEESISY